ncbi:MAG: 50S ribosomal protein L29 [Dehalococcoidia bacterium]
MSRQDVRTLRDQSDEALERELAQAHEALFRLRFQGSTRQLADNSQIGKGRRRLALIKTLLHERRLANLAVDASVE